MGAAEALLIVAVLVLIGVYMYSRHFPRQRMRRPIRGVMKSTPTQRPYYPHWASRLRRAPSEKIISRCEQDPMCAAVAAADGRYRPYSLQPTSAAVYYEPSDAAAAAQDLFVKKAYKLIPIPETNAVPELIRPRRE